MGKISKFWNFISQVSGVYGTYILATLGLAKLVSFIHDLNLSPLMYTIIGIVVLVLVLGSISFFIKQNNYLFQKIIRSHLEKESRENVRKFQNKAANSPLDLTLPSTHQLKIFRKTAREEAKNWASDAVEDDITVTIRKYDKKFSLVSHVSFTSQWKKQYLSIFIGMGDNIRQSKSEITIQFPNWQPKPFFVKYKNWDKAVLQAYQKIDNKVNNLDYELTLSSAYKNFYFTFEYYEGDVKTKIPFEFDGVYLFAKDGSKFKLKK
jgi:hypothetical protein